MTEQTLYQRVIAAGIKPENHYSDLRMPVCPVATRLIAEAKADATTFLHAVHGTRWYDVPLAFDPYWDALEAQHIHKDA